MIAKLKTSIAKFKHLQAPLEEKRYSSIQNYTRPGKDTSKPRIAMVIQA